MVETGPRPTGILSLIIVGIGLALIATETRHDEEVLSTVGATPRIRRALAAARAGVLSLIGGTLAVPAGMLPIWGLFTSANNSTSIGMTVPWVSVMAVVLVTLPWPASAPGCGVPDTFKWPPLRCSCRFGGGPTGGPG